MRILQKFGKAPCTGERIIPWPAQDSTNRKKSGQAAMTRMEFELPNPTFEYLVPQTASHIVSFNVLLIVYSFGSLLRTAMKE
jgi:hypothetical protein